MNVLLVEDDKNLAFSVAKGLKEEGYSVLHAANGADARRFVDKETIDIILLDLGLPDGDGLGLLQEWREFEFTLPVIILSARSTLEDKVKGLNLGADDYIVKPFAFEELLARIQTRFRGQDAQALSMVHEIEDLTVDLNKREASRAGEVIDMSPREFDLLAYLVQKKGQVVSREMLSADVWKVNARATSLDNAIDVYVFRLRDKIDKGHDVKLIKTVRGVGFKLVAPE